MDIVDIERFNDRKLRGILTEERIHQDLYGTPEENRLAVCPDCGEVGESFSTIEHKGWCFYSRGMGSLVF